MTRGDDDASSGPTGSTTDPVLVRYRWDPEAAVIAFRVHDRASRWRWLQILARVVVFLVYLPITTVFPIMIARHVGWTTPAGLAALACAFGFGCVWLWVFDMIRRGGRSLRQARRAFADTSLGPHVVKWEIHRDDLISRTPISAATVRWSLFIKAVESPQGFLLYQSRSFFNWLPSVGFASEADMRRFSRMVREHVANFRELAPAQFAGERDTPELRNL